MRRTPRLVVLAVIVAACAAEAGPVTEDDAGGAAPSDAGAPTRDSSTADASTDAAPQDAAPADAADAAPMPYTTVFTILMENHDYAEIIGSANAPYINGLLSEGALLTNYHDSGVHPSLPNYLVLASGAPQYSGGVDLNPTQAPFPVKADHLGHQLEVAKIEWRSYQESMGTACKLTIASPYGPKHDPFLYFDDIQNGPNKLCAKRNVDYTQFPADLASGAYRYMWITPNLIHDGHDPTNDPVTGLKQSDAWLKQELPKILNSATYQAGGVVFITWDEAEGRNGHSKSQVPMIVLSPHLKAKGTKDKTLYSHKSYLATVEDLFGLPRLATVKAEASMVGLFK